MTSTVHLGSYLASCSGQPQTSGSVCHAEAIWAWLSWWNPPETGDCIRRAPDLPLLYTRSGQRHKTPKFPDEGLADVVRNVFDFDNKDMREVLITALHKHAFPSESNPPACTCPRSKSSAPIALYCLWMQHHEPIPCNTLSWTNITTCWRDLLCVVLKLYTWTNVFVCEVCYFW